MTKKVLLLPFLCSCTHCSAILLLLILPSDHLVSLRPFGAGYGPPEPCSMFRSFGFPPLLLLLLLIASPETQPNQPTNLPNTPMPSPSWPVALTPRSHLASSILFALSPGDLGLGCLLLIWAATLGQGFFRCSFSLISPLSSSSCSSHYISQRFFRSFPSPKLCCVFLLSHT